MLPHLGNVFLLLSHQTIQRLLMLCRLAMNKATQKAHLCDSLSRFRLSRADKELVEHFDGQEEQNTTQHDANASSFQAGTHYPRAGLAADK